MGMVAGPGVREDRHQDNGEKEGDEKKPRG